MRSHYSVQVASKGRVLIPAAVRNAMATERRSLLILSQQGEELRLVPAEIVPRRGIRMVPREEPAQALIDGPSSPGRRSPAHSQYDRASSQLTHTTGSSAFSGGKLPPLHTG